VLFTQHRGQVIIIEANRNKRNEERTDLKRVVKCNRVQKSQNGSKRHLWDINRQTSGVDAKNKDKKTRNYRKNIYYSLMSQTKKA